jgi:hypothetical protein
VGADEELGRWDGSVGAARCVVGRIVPWRDAIGGAFRPPDFAQDIAAARILAANADPYAANFAAVHAQVLGIPSTDGYPYLPHPPLVIVLSWPFAGVTFGVAALCWFAGSLACAFVLAIVLSGFARRQTSFGLPRLSDALLCFGGLLVWPPVLYNLEKGQFSILIAMLVAVGWVWISHRGYSAAGICMGLAAALKLFPALLALVSDDSTQAVRSVVRHYRRCGDNAPFAVARVARRAGVRRPDGRKPVLLGDVAGGDVLASRVGRSRAHREQVVTPGCTCAERRQRSSGGVERRLNRNRGSHDAAASEETRL